jgi:thiamine kinase-like enzyme
VISAVPGESLLDFSWDAKGNDVYIAIHLVLEGVKRLHAITDALLQEPVAKNIPSKTLLGELEGIQTRGGPWLDVAEFRAALKWLEKMLPAIERPLVFSNGDYNPGNFLFLANEDANSEEKNHSIGNPGSLAKIPHRLTGLVDFSWSCFEDPHIGFAKYWTYDWFPAGMVERYLYVNSLTAKEFAPRLALRCLWTLQREMESPIVDPRPNWHRDNLLGLLQVAMHS